MDSPELEPKPDDESLPTDKSANEVGDVANLEQEPTVYSIDNLPEVCGFVITEEGRQLTVDDIPRYLDSAAEQLAQLEATDSDEYQRYSIGLFLHIAEIKYRAGDIAGALKDIDEAYAHAENKEWQDILDAIKPVGRMLEDALYGEGVDPSAPTPDAL